MKPIRNSAKAIIIEDGKVLLTKNIDKLGYFYLFPGGGQEPGEELSKTLMRECIEETGKEVNVGELVYVRDYIGKNHEFAEWNFEDHQVEFYFLCSIKFDDGKTDNGCIPDSMQVGIEWIDIAQLEDIRLYPKVLAKRIKEKIQTPIYLGDVN
jgi:8-oxo-dGTP pyrophosphatase MutT (NUDIX family)